MELSIQNLSLNAAVILTGLSAGFFYAWSVSVIPGTQKIDDLSYLNAMQSINREILNPAFFIVFFGSLITLICTTYFSYGSSTGGFWLLVVSTMSYLIGTLGVTGRGNVPLNNELEALDIAKLGAKQIAEFREHYELRWNKLHTYRMIFSVLAFILAVLALNIQWKN